MNHLKMEDNFFYWPMGWVTLGLWEGRALHRRPSHLLKNSIIINLPFRGRMFTKEVDEQMLNVQNKNTTYLRYIIFNNILNAKKIQKGDFSTTFICAVSNIKVYGLLGDNSTITSNEVKYYIRQFFEYRNQDPNLANKPFILMYDNAKVHTSDAVFRYIIKSKLM